MISGTSQTFKVPADSLVRLYESFARALLEVGLSGARLNETLSRCLRVECVQCRIQISAQELEQLALSDAGADVLHPKLQRLRLGYCARQGCESYFYDVHLENHPDLDWEVIARKVENLLAASNETARLEPERRKPRRLVLFAGLGLVVLTVVLWLMHGHLPFATKRHKYEIDPASTTPVSRH